MDVTNYQFEMKKLLAAVDAAEIVSFDIFDTLIYRPYIKPTDIFLLIERESNVVGFCEARIKAELTLRDRLPNSESDEEITFDQIYDEIDPRFSPLKSVEAQYELSSNFRNEEMGRVYDYAKKKKKRIIITSDMYLPKDLIEKILRKCGYSEYESLFLSSVIKKQKAGSLFQHIGKTLNIVRPKAFLHIGDNLYGDVLQARSAGFSAFYYPKILERYAKGSLLGKETIDRIAAANDVDLSHVIMSVALYQVFRDDREDPLHQLGVEIVWPISMMFSFWVARYCEVAGIKNLFFMSRDGFLFKKIFDSIISRKHDFQCEKLHVSRRAVAIPVEFNIDQTRSLLFYGLGAREFDVNVLWSSLCIDNDNLKEQFKEYLHQRGLGAFVSAEILREFIVENEYAFSEVMNEEVESLRQYLSFIGLLDGRCAVIDIGWSGTMQRALELAAMHGGQFADMVGLYLGTGEGCLIPHGKGAGYLVDRGLPQENANLLFGRIPTVFGDIIDLIELLFTVPAKSVRGFTTDSNATFPTYLPYTAGEQLRGLVSAGVNSGIEDIIAHYTKAPYAQHQFYVNDSSSGVIELVKVLSQLPDHYRECFQDVNVFMGHSELSAKNPA